MSLLKEQKKKKKIWKLVYKEKSHFLHATESSYEKKNPYDKDKGKVKGKRLTPSYRQWVHLCRCTGRGLLLLLRSDIVVPSARLMNESPCNRSSQLTLSLQQTKKSSLPHCSLHITQTIRVEEKKKKEGGTESPPILSFSLLVQKK